MFMRKKDDRCSTSSLFDHDENNIVIYENICIYLLIVITIKSYLKFRILIHFAMSMVY
jgi:hypothetical protein